MTTERTELKPCPFCGAVPQVFAEDDEGTVPLVAGHSLRVSVGRTHYGVRCLACDIGMNNPFCFEKDAITAWNSRSLTPQAGEGVVEQVASEIESFMLGRVGHQVCVNAAKRILAALPPAGRVEELVVRITEHAVMELDADEENTLQINAFGEAVEREIRAALGSHNG